MLDPTTPVATIVLDHSECAPVFARYRIDYCCKGERPLIEACGELGLDLRSVVDELERTIKRRHPGNPPIDPRTLSTRDVILKAIAPHHQYLHRMLPFLNTLAAKVTRVHGAREPRLRQVADRFSALADTLIAHLHEEETLLFPALIAGREQSVVPMLNVMRAEHEQIGGMLADLRHAAEDFEPPDWACTSYRTLMAELAGLEADVLEHVHLENHVLLPRFIH